MKTKPKKDNGKRLCFVCSGVKARCEKVEIWYQQGPRNICPDCIRFFPELKKKEADYER